MENPPWLLLISLLLNVVVLGVGAIYLVRRGGLAYFKSRLRKMPEQSRADYFAELHGIFRAMPVQKNAIIFLGDSLTARCPWNELLVVSNILNRGLGGETTEDIESRLDEITRHQPRQIFLLAGINDLLQGTHPDVVLRNIQRIVTKLQDQTPTSQIVLQSLLPVNEKNTSTPVLSEAERQSAAWNTAINHINNSLGNWASDVGVVYADVHSHLLDANGKANDKANGKLSASYSCDGLHLNARGYALWAEVVRPLLTHSN